MYFISTLKKTFYAMYFQRYFNVALPGGNNDNNGNKSDINYTTICIFLVAKGVSEGID